MDFPVNSLTVRGILCFPITLKAAKIVSSPSFSCCSPSGKFKRSSLLDEIYLILELFFNSNNILDDFKVVSLSEHILTSFITIFKSNKVTLEASVNPVLAYVRKLLIN